MADLNNYAQLCHDANRQWWLDPATGDLCIRITRGDR